MTTLNIAGALVPFFDPSTGQQVTGSIAGRVTLQSLGGDPNAALPQLQAKILSATSMVLQQKLAAGQVAVPTIAHSMPAFVQEIAAQSDAASLGVQITGLELAFTPTPAAPMPGAALPGPGMPMDPMSAMKASLKQKAEERLDPRNYELKARVNVGGFRINASTKDGVDTEGLKNQVKGKIKTEITWLAIGGVVVLAVVCLLCGLGGYVWWQFKKSASGASTSLAESQAASWDGTTPFSCGGVDHIRLENVTATLPNDTAIHAGANCELELVNVNIDAKVGIEAGANAHVTVTGGSVKGTEAAVSALGNAHVTFTGTTVTGEKSSLGGATITGP